MLYCSHISTVALCQFMLALAIAHNVIPHDSLSVLTFLKVNYHLLHFCGNEQRVNTHSSHAVLQLVR